MYPDYPYTDAHQLNLDWLVTNVTELKEELDSGSLIGPPGPPGDATILSSISYKYAYTYYSHTSPAPVPSRWYDTVGLAAAAYGDISGALLYTRITTVWKTGEVYNAYVHITTTYQGKDGVPSATEIQNAVDEYLTDHPTVTGTFTNAAKHALLALLKKVAYIDEHGQEYLDTLETELFALAVDSISAVFNPGANVIYTGDSLDSLKQYLTVTATYTDATIEVLSDSVYTLNGTLAAGINTITVSYGGKTTTFNVTATYGENLGGTFFPGASFSTMSDSVTLQVGVTSPPGSRLGYAAPEGVHQVTVVQGSIEVYPLLVPQAATKMIFAFNDANGTPNSNVGMNNYFVKWDGTNWKRTEDRINYTYGSGEHTIVSADNDGTLYAVFTFRNTANDNTINSIDRSHWVLAWR